MSLLKMIPNPNMNNWAQKKAKEIIDSMASRNLILEAYLFGSAVDGVFTKNSDLDIVVVAKDETDIRQLHKEVYSARFTDIAIDWIFKTKESFDERKRIGGVCFVAFHNGKKLK